MQGMGLVQHNLCQVKVLSILTMTGIGFVQNNLCQEWVLSNIIYTRNRFYLTLKAPTTTAADDIHKYFSLFYRDNKT